MLGPDGKGSAGSFFHYNEAYGALLQTASEGAAPASRASAPFPGRYRGGLLLPAAEMLTRLISTARALCAAAAACSLD